MSMVMRAVGCLASLVSVFGLVVPVGEAEACPAPQPWKAEQVSGEWPDCMSVAPGSGYQQSVVSIENGCDSRVELTGLERCPVPSDDEQGCHLESDEHASVTVHHLGLSEADYEDGDDFESGLEWAMEGDRGGIHVDGRYDMPSGSCSMGEHTGCGGCAQGGEGAPVGGLAVVLLVLAGGRGVYRVSGRV